MIMDPQAFILSTVKPTKKERTPQQSVSLDVNEPIPRDPILVRQYREAIKRLPQRGRVDPMRTIHRSIESRERAVQNERLGERQNAATEIFRERTDTMAEQEEEPAVHSISQETYLCTCKHVGVRLTQAIFSGLAKTTLSLKYHHLGPLGIKAASIALVCNTAVATVDLTSTDAGPQGATYIADTLRENLYMLDLTLAENAIGSEGIAALCDALKENRTLKYLSVAGNRLVESDARFIRDMLSENTTLKGLNISHNKFMEMGGILLAEGLDSNDTLQDIDFSWNYLRQKGAIRIMQSLQANTGVKRADLSYNGFHDGAQNLSEVLSSNATLTYLDISGNRLTDGDMAVIMKGFAKNDTLETLLIGKNPFTPKCCHKILEIICENPNNKVKELDLNDQAVEVEFLDFIDKIRKQRQFYIVHGPVLKATLHKEVVDDFENADPMMVLMECMAQRQLKVVDLFTKIDKDGSQTISKSELRKGLESFNIPMSPKAVDQLMKILDIDENGVIDFAEFMEGHREYLKKKQEADSNRDMAAKATKEVTKLSEKVTKLIKKRRLAKMALVLDTSTEQLKRVIKMNKELPARNPAADFVDQDSIALERIAKLGLQMAASKSGSNGNRTAKARMK